LSSKNYPPTAEKGYDAWIAQLSEFQLHLLPCVGSIFIVTP